MDGIGHVDCFSCLIGNAEKMADRFSKNSAEKMAFMKNCLSLMIKTEDDLPAPCLYADLTELAKKTFAQNIDFYAEEKKYYNEKIMAMENDIEQVVNDSSDPLFTSLKVAAAGNIIDFGAVKDLNIDFVAGILKETLAKKFDESLWETLQKQLQASAEIFYLGDNTGEIVFDKIFIKNLRLAYPDLRVNYVTRGIPVLNDVTEKDAYEVGIDAYANIINNGTGIPGTVLANIDGDLAGKLKKAEVILAKGQGNFETLLGCGLNVYYIFLCKCDAFLKKFQIPRYQNVFINELDLNRGNINEK